MTSLPCQTTTGSYSIPTFTINSIFLTRFLSKTSQISAKRKGKKLSCSVKDSVQSSSTGSRHPSGPDPASPVKFDRRNLILGLGCGGAILSLEALITSTTSGSSTMDKTGEAIAAEIPTTTTFPHTLEKPVKVVVPRPKKSRSMKEKEDEEEILVIDGIEFQNDAYTKFDVYVNDEDAGTSSPKDTEFLGSFASLPNKQRQGKRRTCQLFGLTEVLQELGADDDDSIVVTLVPRAGNDPVSIGEIKIEFGS